MAADSQKLNLLGEHNLLLENKYIGIVVFKWLFTLTRLIKDNYRFQEREISCDVF